MPAFVHFFVAMVTMQGYVHIFDYERATLTCLDVFVFQETSSLQWMIMQANFFLIIEEVLESLV